MYKAQHSWKETFLFNYFLLLVISIFWLTNFYLYVNKDYYYYACIVVEFEIFSIFCEKINFPGKCHQNARIFANLKCSKNYASMIYKSLFGGLVRIGS